MYRAARRYPLRSATAALAAVALLAVVVAMVVREPRQPDESRTLVADSAPVGQFRWLLGEGQSHIVAAGAADPFAVHSDATGLIELCATPPWPQFRLHGLVRQDASKQDGDVGLFFAHNLYDTDRGRQHVFWYVNFTELNRASGSAELDVARVATVPGAWQDGIPINGAALPFGIVRPGMPSPWHALAVEVTGDRIAAYFDDRLITEAPTASMRTVNKQMLTGMGEIKGSFTPHGALGIYVRNGAASFKQVVMHPLP
jgi:hypothetical protein